MRRLMITLEYEGTGFQGWQLQAQGRTVQGVLEDALRRTTGQAIRVTGASRTDSGVHAEGHVAHFDTESALRPGQVLRALNHWLPADVAVLDCREVSADFDARASASSKLYRYRILRSKMRRPLRERFALREWRSLDVDAMRGCANLLVGEHDFSSFASEHTQAASNRRHLMRSELVERDDELHYLVEANGFLYNMVRVIVGTLLAVGRGKIAAMDFADILHACDRGAAGPTAPARGLTLVRVNYRNDPRPKT